MSHSLATVRRLTTVAAVVAALAAVAAVAAPAAAQSAAAGVPNRETALEIRKQFTTDLDTLQSKFLALAEAIPAEKYSWRPAAGVRSIGEAFMHVASEFYVFTPMAYGAQRSPVIPRGRENFQKFEQMSTKPDVLKHLREGFAYTKQQLAAIPADSLVGPRQIFGGQHTIVETSLTMSADLHEHLGQLIAYARMNGVKPPWSN
jgi:hypothetical protein